MRRLLVPVAALLLAGFTAPWQPWRSPDGRVALLRPAIAAPQTSDAPLGSLMTRGWRLVWTGQPAGPGRIVLRVVLPVRPPPGASGTAVEALQIGASNDPGVVRACATYGLAGAPTGSRLADRRIGGVRFAVWTERDAGMSQQIIATELRAVRNGRCYAVARFRYVTEAAPADPSATLAEAEGAALLDRALASLRIGDPAPMPHAPALSLPSGAVAR